SPPTVIDGVGGMVSAGRFELTVPPGALASSTDVRLTELSPLGLTAPLPLGWSPVGGVQIEPAGTSLTVPAVLRLTADALAGASIVLARYDETQHLWITEEIGLTGETLVSASITVTGAYAFLVPDTGATAPPAPVAGNELPGSEPVDVAFGLSATSEVTPAISPVSPAAMATGSVALSSLVELPSGSLVSARVEESFDSFAEGELRTEPFAQEIPVYRFPPRDDEALHASFPVAPTRQFDVDEILDGRIHVEIRPSPSFVRGALVGEDGQVVGGPNGAELTIAEGALANTVAAFVEAFDPASLNLGFQGVSLVGAAEVDLAGATLAVPGTLSIPADLASGEHLFAARFLFVAGQRKLSLLGPAAFGAGRVSIEGVESGGTHLFFQSDEPLALVRGVVTEGGNPARLAVVESSSAPFMDVTADDGIYQVVAALRETTISARSLVSGNIGSTLVTPATTDPVEADVVLSTTGPFVATVTPPNGQQGVALAPVIQVTFSEPVDPTTVDLSSFTLTKSSDGTPVSGRVVLGPANRSASFLPTNNLEPLTSYGIALTAGVTDTSGNGLLPFNSSFTTLEDAPAGFDPDAVTVSFPDDEGNVLVEAPPGSFESGASVLILNNTNGIVVSGVVNPDGGFSFQIRAAITDELQIRIVDSADREVVIEKTEYRAADGSVAIGKKGGKIAVGEFLLDVPEGALDGAAIFQLRPLTQEEIDALPLPEGAGGLGSGVEVDMGEVRLDEEADLSFPVPLDAPPDADFLIVRKVELEDLILYETIDSASVQDGKVVTNSFPFLGVLATGVYQPIWFPPLPSTGKSPLGVITGIARESDGNPIQPEIVPLPDVLVIADKNLGLGDYTASTDENGRFTLWDANFGTSGGTVNLVATDAKNREVRAIAFENQGLSS
ncbi:MAG: Ig-like domain-containing protein, partial [Vicinamibacteria bacterium]